MLKSRVLCLVYGAEQNKTFVLLTNASDNDLAHSMLNIGAKGRIHASRRTVSGGSAKR